MLDFATPADDDASSDATVGPPMPPDENDGTV